MEGGGSLKRWGPLGEVTSLEMSPFGRGYWVSGLLLFLLHLGVMTGAALLPTMMHCLSIAQSNGARGLNPLNHEPK